MMKPCILFLCLTALSGCGASSVQPEDSVLSQSLEVGQEDAALDRLEPAKTQYEAAWKQALARDDVQALGDTGYNLAVVELALDKPQDSLTTIAQTREALSTRATSSDLSLALVEGAALHRLGQDDRAGAILQSVISGSPNPYTERACLILAQVGDSSGHVELIDLAATHLRHKGKVSAIWQADEAEVESLSLVTRGQNPSAASDMALSAANARRGWLDYKGMSRALALAARAKALGHDYKTATALWLRAAQSAYARGDHANATVWFAKAGYPDGYGMDGLSDRGEKSGTQNSDSSGRKH